MIRSPTVGQVSAFTLLREDGTELPVELIVNAVGCGPQLTFNAFARDMTVLSEARAAQRSRDATCEAVFANAPIGIAVVGLNGTFERVNRALCRITGIRRAATGRADVSGHHPSGRPQRRRT